MNDDDFIRDFEAGTLPPSQFHHRDHLRLTWLLLDRAGPEAAGARVAGAIRAFAALHGHEGKYHETVTRFWVRLLVQVRAERPARTLDEALAAMPMLLDKDLPLRHWTHDRLFSAAAREGWLEPDLVPVP